MSGVEGLFIFTPHGGDINMCPAEEFKIPQLEKDVFVIPDFPGSRSIGSGIIFPGSSIARSRGAGRRTWRKPETGPDREKPEDGAGDDRLPIGKSGEKSHGCKKLTAPCVWTASTVSVTWQTTTRRSENR
jgi:hypothetical protein